MRGGDASMHLTMAASSPASLHRSERACAALESGRVGHPSPVSQLVHSAIQSCNSFFGLSAAKPGKLAIASTLASSSFFISLSHFDERHATERKP
jgi:hypothetical protein